MKADAYDELYSSASTALHAAGRMVAAVTDSATILSEAGDAAHRIVVSNHINPYDYGKLDLNAALVMSLCV